MSNDKSLYLNTCEGFALSTSTLLYAEKEDQEDVVSEELPSEDDPEKSKVADYRVRCRKDELSMNDISSLCQSFVVRKDVWRPRWFNYSRFDTSSKMLFARIDCTDKFFETQFDRLPFTSKFLPKQGVPVNAEVLNEKFFWDSLLTVKTDKFAKLKEIVEEKGDSLKRLRLVFQPKRQPAPPPGFVRSGELPSDAVGSTNFTLPPGFVRSAQASSSQPATSSKNSQPNGFVRSNNVSNSKFSRSGFNGQQARNNQHVSDKGTRKVDLLTTMTQMIQMFYPMVGLETEQPTGLPPVLRTKDYYAVVKHDSPLFFMDTEMCLTEINLLELTRVTLLSEDGRTLIDTFVKPKNKIVDYLTFYSGITEQALVDVKVSLVDVQKAFQRILPPDAILCGHSIEGDLRALRLSHPFCIDTSYVYNLTKFSKRTSLRGLAFFFLNKRIQCTGKGHCSYQDSLIVSNLVQLKLKGTRSFGIAQFGFNYVEWARKNGLENCADFFEKALVKDVTKDEYKPLELPMPRQVGKCSDCNEPLMSQCYIEDCLCSKNYPEHCCLCVGFEINHPKPVGKEEFIFGKEIKMLQSLGDQSTSLSDCLRNYKEGRVLIARYLDSNESMYKMSGKRIPVYDMNSHDNIELFKKFVLNFNVYSCDLCLLEYNGRWVDPEEIDNYIRAIHDESSNNAVIGLLFCTETKAVFYANTKIQQK